MFNMKVLQVSCLLFCWIYSIESVLFNENGRLLTEKEPRYRAAIQRILVQKCPTIAPGKVSKKCVAARKSVTTTNRPGIPPSWRRDNFPIAVNPIMFKFEAIADSTAASYISNATTAPFGGMEVEVNTDVITEATTVFESTTMINRTTMTTTDMSEINRTAPNYRKSPPNSQPYSPTVPKLSEKEKKQQDRQEKQDQKKQDRQEKQDQKKQDRQEKQDQKKQVRQEKQDQKKQVRQEKQDQKQQDKKDQNQQVKQLVPLNRYQQKNSNKRSSEEYFRN